MKKYFSSVAWIQSSAWSRFDYVTGCGGAKREELHGGRSRSTSQVPVKYQSSTMSS